MSHAMMANRLGARRVEFRDQFGVKEPFGNQFRLHFFRPAVSFVNQSSAFFFFFFASCLEVSMFRRIAPKKTPSTKRAKVYTCM
jgi:hypothetical protein